MARIRIDYNQLVLTATQIADDGGLSELSLSRVANALGVRPSALYTHVDGADGLHYVVAVHATIRLTTNVRNAAVGVAGRPALRSMAVAYREFASKHPGQYAATLAPPGTDRSELDEAAAELVSVLARVFSGLGLGQTDANRAAAAMRSGLHGFLALEVTDSPRAEDHFDHLVELLTQGVES